MQPESIRPSNEDRARADRPPLDEIERSLEKTLEALRSFREKGSPGPSETDLEGASMPAMAELKALREAARSPEDWRALTERLGTLTRGLGPEWRASGDLRSYVLLERDLEGPVQGLAFSDGRPFAIVGDRVNPPKRVRLELDREAGIVSSDLGWSRGSGSGAVSADGRFAALSPSGADRMVLLSLEGSSVGEVGSIPLECLGVSSATFSPAGNLIAVSFENSWRSKIDVYSVPDTARVASIEIPNERSSIGSIAISPSGDQLAFSYTLRSPRETDRLRIVSLEHLPERNGRPKAIFDAACEGTSALSYTPDGKLLWCDAAGAVRSGSVKPGAIKAVMSAKDLADSFEWEGRADLGAPATLVAISASGKTVAIATSDSFVRILDMTESWPDGSPAIAAYFGFVHGPGISTPRLTSLVMSPDGKAIAVGDSEGKVNVLGTLPDGGMRQERNSAK